MRHIFLTGAKQIGKSTVWRKVLERSGLECSGFLTLPYLVSGTFRGYCMHALDTVPEGFQNDVPISLQLQPGKHLGIPETFEQFGVQLLRQANASGKCIMMDELGKFERSAAAFQQAVMACLDGPQRVLGVLQDTSNPFLDSIRSREDIHLITVTNENRDTLPDKLLAILRQ